MSSSKNKSVAQLNEEALANIKNSKSPITIGRLINFTIITSEYQSAIEVAKKLTTALPEIYHNRINERLADLEQQSRNELMMAFNLMANEHQLEKTPIYQDDDFEAILNYYLALANDYFSDPLKLGFNTVALTRRKSPVLYFLNSPVHKVNQFLNHEGYTNLLTDANVTDGEILQIHETLFYMYSLESENFNDIKDNLHILHKETLDTLELHNVIV